MLKVFAIGNLTRDPELRATQSGVQVCSFTLAVNRKKATEADYIRVNAWRGLAENCHRYLSKGKKAAVTGTLTLSSYTLNDGQQRYQMELMRMKLNFDAKARIFGLCPCRSDDDAPWRTCLILPICDGL